MASKDNMGVADQEFISAGNAIGSYAEALVRMIDGYTASVKKICDNAIQDQLICQRLSSLTEQVNSLRDPLEDISKQAAKDCKAFVEAIDNADKFLY